MNDIFENVQFTAAQIIVVAPGLNKVVNDKLKKITELLNSIETAPSIEELSEEPEKPVEKYTHDDFYQLIDNNLPQKYGDFNLVLMMFAIQRFAEFIKKMLAIATNEELIKHLQELLGIAGLGVRLIENNIVKI